MVDFPLQDELCPGVAEHPPLRSKLSTANLHAQKEAESCSIIFIVI